MAEPTKSDSAAKLTWIFFLCLMHVLYVESLWSYNLFIALIFDGNNSNSASWGSCHSTEWKQRHRTIPNLDFVRCLHVRSHRFSINIQKIRNFCNPNKFGWILPFGARLKFQPGNDLFIVPYASHQSRIRACDSYLVCASIEWKTFLPEISIPAKTSGGLKDFLPHQLTYIDDA